MIRYNKYGCEYYDFDKSDIAMIDELCKNNPQADDLLKTMLGLSRACIYVSPSILKAYLERKAKPDK